MSPARNNTKTIWQTILPIVWPVLSFLAGLGITQINQGNDVKQLTTAVNNLSGQLKEYQDTQGKMGNRVTALETRVFGTPQLTYNSNR
ncbi:hypothetical protein HQ865_01140 [Mucilaginibacter mali]|uniref:Uncharacterized protein n=1 Tax=Mucilaginibacter mali TaxID=2740462 RepID=A0A7D4UBR5_9SPHI|nr:hypothetical protein [Mucilaginibacter mali]QKJ28419.1 hypothetical protein HQ865_01140 [Mucilaginibacter mali]